MLKFSQWLEAKTLSNSPNKTNNELYSANPTSEDINGWRVYFDIPPTEIKTIDRAKNAVRQALANLQSLNLRKSLRVPIIIAGKNLMFHGRYASHNTGPLNSGESVAHTPFIRMYANYGTIDPNWVVHEIAHAIYSRFSVAQQEQIKKLAYQYPKISHYGNPNSGRGDIENGSEWFAELIKLLASTSASQGGFQLGEEKIPFNVIKTIKIWLSETNTAPQTNKFLATDKRPNTKGSVQRIRQKPQPMMTIGKNGTLVPVGSEEEEDWNPFVK